MSGSRARPKTFNYAALSYGFALNVSFYERREGRIGSSRTSWGFDSARAQVGKDETGMPSLRVTRTHRWAFAGAVVLGALSGCSGDDAGTQGGSSGAAGSTSASGSGGAAGSAGSQSGTTSTAGKASGGSGGSGAPATCRDLACTSGQMCVSHHPLFVGETSAECAAIPAGCDTSTDCDCDLTEWEGSPVYGCSGIMPPVLLVFNLSCGDAPCAAGTVCLVDETGTKPPVCVAPPSGCAADAKFCRATCPREVAAAAGMELVDCEVSGTFAGVITKPL